MASKLRGLELLQAVVQSGDEVETLSLDVSGETVEIQYRRLGWLAKSRVISAATEYAPATDPKTGQTTVRVVFHLDTYKKAALKEMVVSSPIPLTDAVLEKLPEEIGAQIEAIIPDPWGVGTAVGSAKKGSATSPEAGDP